MVSRLYVGGLPESVTEESIKARFNTFGHVVSVELPAVKVLGGEAAEARSHRGFGYVELVPSDDAAVRRCIGAVRPNEKPQRPHSGDFKMEVTA